MVLTSLLPKVFHFAWNYEILIDTRENTLIICLDSQAIREKARPVTNLIKRRKTQKPSEICANRGLELQFPQTYANI